jgi:hypothetical protein
MLREVKKKEKGVLDCAFDDLIPHIARCLFVLHDHDAPLSIVGMNKDVPSLAPAFCFQQRETPNAPAALDN